MRDQGANGTGQKEVVSSGENFITAITSIRILKYPLYSFVIHCIQIGAVISIFSKTIIIKHLWGAGNNIFTFVVRGY